MAAITKELKEKLEEMGVKEFSVHWQGGSDEGYLSVNAPSADAEKLIEEWAEEAFSYSGAGDGSDYGDDYYYDLEKGTVRHSDWYMSRQEGDEEEYEIEETE